MPKARANKALEPTPSSFRSFLASAFGRGSPPAFGFKGVIPLDIQEFIGLNPIFFRDQLRNARNRAIDDAENFDELLYAFERLGCVLTGKLGSLHEYTGRILALAGFDVAILFRTHGDKDIIQHTRCVR
jgi:hypothetical protein